MGLSQALSTAMSGLRATQAAISLVGSNVANSETPGYVRKTVIRQLHDLGYKTVEADSGAKALELTRSGLKFDLLLTDVIMPGGMTGYQLADELRADRTDLKVLFTSGYTELAASNGSSARSDPLLSKPYRKQDLGRAVRTALDASEPSDATRPS